MQNISLAIFFIINPNSQPHHLTNGIWPDREISFNAMPKTQRQYYCNEVKKRLIAEN